MANLVVVNGTLSPASSEVPTHDAWSGYGGLKTYPGVPSTAVLPAAFNTLGSFLFDYDAGIIYTWTGAWSILELNALNIKNGSIDGDKIAGSSILPIHLSDDFTTIYFTATQTQAYIDSLGLITEDLANQAYTYKVSVVEPTDIGWGPTYGGDFGYLKTDGDFLYVCVSGGETGDALWGRTPLDTNWTP